MEIIISMLKGVGLGALIIIIFYIIIDELKECFKEPEEGFLEKLDTRFKEELEEFEEVMRIRNDIEDLLMKEIGKRFIIIFNENEKNVKIRRIKIGNSN